MRRFWRVVAAGLTAGLMAACSDAAGSSPPIGPPAVGAPQPSGGTFYVSDESSAAHTAQRLGGTDAGALRRITEQPSALWLTGPDGPEEAGQRVARARSADRTALLVAYRIPHRDCGQYSAGGAADAEEYRRWIHAVAERIGDGRAWVVLEPDAVAHTLDGCADAEQRYQLLAYAVRELKRGPQTRVYLDAGNAGWVKDTAALAGALRRAGIDGADGFALNVSNFYTTELSATYGDRLSVALGGKHFVIDTSRNGRGPMADHTWCNPPGRALGDVPTTATGRPGVDAYLWVKNPGESDGDCGRGEPPAGEFWPAYALDLLSR